MSEVSTAALVGPEKKENKTTQLSLLKQFIPLSLSDVAMALGEPMQTVALTRLPEP